MKEKTKKSFIAKVSETLMIVTLIAELGFLTKEDGLNQFLQYLIVPATFFFISVMYNLPIIAPYFAATISFLNGIGINGIPAIALVVLVVVGVLNITTGDKILSDMVKLVSGFTTGSFAQKAAVSRNLRRATINTRKHA